MARCSEEVVIHEKLWDASKYKAKEVIQLIKEAGLMRSLEKSKAYREQLVLEVVASLPEGFGDESSSEFGTVLVRGKEAKISPEMIDEYFGIGDSEDDGGVIEDMATVARVLTGGKRVSWGEHVIPSKELTVKFTLLYFIGIWNWIPGRSRISVTKPMGLLLYYIGSKKRMSLGTVIFNQIASHAGLVKGAQSIEFPSLIADLVITQLPDVLKKGEKFSREPKAFTANHKLFAKSRVHDLSDDIIFKKTMKISGVKLGGSIEGDRAKILAAIEDELAHLTQTISQHLARKKVLTALAREIRYLMEDEPVETDDDEEEDSSES